MNKETLSLLYQKYLLSGKKVCTDTRLLQQGELFFCLRGPSFNGNAFAEKALASGARWVVLDDPEYLNEHSEQQILVDNTLEALQELAQFERKQWKFPVIGIGGSNGKTTTKELVTRVLQKKYKVHATKGNLNNHIGVPLTILSVPEDTEIAVIELGTNSPGEIAELCKISQPDYGIITNIGKEHLEGFGSLEAVAFEESQLYLHLLEAEGTAFVNADDEWLQRMASRLKNVQHYGREIKVNDRSYRFRLEKSNPYLCFEYDGQFYETHLFGAFNFSNILAALSVGLYFHVSVEECLHAVCEYVPENNRSQIRVTGNIQLIIDCYNANPSSMESALRSLGEMEGRRKIAMLGDMFELGEHAPEEHRHIAELAVSLPIDQVVLIGEEFSKVRIPGVKTYLKAEEVISDLSEWVSQEDVAILLKASRGMKLESLMPHIEAINKR